MTKGQRIKRARKELKLSQEEFAAKVGITQVAISKIESGVNDPDDRTIRVIESAHGISYNWIMNGSGEMLVQQKPSVSNLPFTIEQLFQMWENAERERRVANDALAKLVEAHTKLADTHQRIVNSKIKSSN